MKPRLQAWGDAKIIPIGSCLVFDQSGRLLLLQRHSEDLGGGMWGTPGGRLDSGEDARSAAAREFREETGIAAPSLELLGVHKVCMPHGTVNMTSYKATIPSSAAITIDPDEHHAYRWFDLKDIRNEANILWGIPTILRDFGFMKQNFVTDPTLADGSEAILLERAKP